MNQAARVMAIARYMVHKMFIVMLDSYEFLTSLYVP